MDGREFIKLVLRWILDLIKDSGQIIEFMMSPLIIPKLEIFGFVIFGGTQFTPMFVGAGVLITLITASLIDAFWPF